MRIYTSALLFMSLVCLLPPASLAEDSHAAEQGSRPWVRPIDRPGFHLGFPLATVIPMLSPKDTGGVFAASLEHIETNYYGPAHVHELSDETIIITAGIRINHLPS